jgi:NAD(P)-dependent dehydrogenase (short-subunit alcohol dehydrogenase family)
MSVESSLRGARVVVIGGTSGMGEGIAREAVLRGAQVIVAGRRPLAERGPAPAVEHELVDLEEEASIRALFERVGPFDHLAITSAPPPGAKPIKEQSMAEALRIVNGKLLGSLAAAKYAAPGLPAGGSITFLTGGVSIRPRAGLAIVSATFAALETLSTALALELGPIRVNTIRPGVIDSAMWNFLDDAGRTQLRANVAKTFPAKRIGTPADIGHAACFLMENRYVTGIVLEVSGGETLVALDI